MSPTRPPPGRPGLLCFAHAGAGPSVFRAWAELFEPEVDVVAVALPGKEGRFREPAPAGLEALVEDLSQALSPRLEGRFALFGHSMGALVAYELARRLRRAGRAQPERLFVSAFRAPHVPDLRPALHALPDALLLAEMRRLDGTPAEVLGQPELMRALIPGLRADLALCERYRHRPEPPLAVPITCLGGLTDRRVSRFELYAWRLHTRADFRLRYLPGGHFFPYQAPSLVRRAVYADLGIGSGPGEGATAGPGASPVVGAGCGVATGPGLPPGCGAEAGARRAEPNPTVGLPVGSAR